MLYSQHILSYKKNYKPYFISKNKHTHDFIFSRVLQNCNGIKCWTMQKKHINFQTYTRRILSSANSYMNVSISLNFFINKHWHPPMHATHTEIKIAYFYFQIYTNSMQFAVHFIPILSYPFLISFFLIYCI